MKNNTILITGAAGSIGSELARQLAKDNQVCALDTNETALFDLADELGLNKWRIGDVRVQETLYDCMAKWGVTKVFHAAALKHVAPNEAYPEETVRTNVMGVLNVIKAMERYGLGCEHLVFISSDKAVNVNSIMGTTKRLGELIVRNARGISVRFGNVMGSRGSVIPIWQRQMDAGQPLTVTDARMERYFMSIPEAVSLVIGAADAGQPGDIVILDMGKTVRVLDLAEKIIAEAKYKKPVKIIGARPGESLKERIMFSDEEKDAVKKGKFYIIPHNSPGA